MSAATTPARVLVIGGGFGGLYCARRLERRLPASAARVVLVNAENFMLFTPLLPEAASGVIEPRHVVVPLRRLLRRTRLLVGSVSALDLTARTCTVTQPGQVDRTVGWDRLVLAPGSVSRTLPIPGLVEHARGFKTLADGIALRNHVLRELEVADASDDPAERRARLTFVVVGAGYAGVELVAELQIMVRKALRDYPGLRVRDLHWVLVDVASTVLPELGDELSREALRVLRRRGVDVRLSTGVERAEADRVVLSPGGPLHTRTFVWTAGVTPHPLVASLGLPVTQAGRLVVDEYLGVRGRDDVFALGDAAAVPDPSKPSGVSPPTAQHALRQAKVAADNVAASLGVGRRRAFEFKGLGLLVNLGGFHGVGKVLGLPVRGFAGWFVTRSYHLLQLPTFTRRLRVALDWAVALVLPNDTAELGSLGRGRP